MDEMKKYIIEFSEDPHTIRLMKLKNGDECPTTEFKAVSPYTEPDTEQVRKEAYQKGYETGYEDGYNEPGKNRQEEYQRGLVDAWKAAKKIALMDTETSENVTGYFGLFRIMENLTPMQAIEKIRAYEQRQEEIKVGDEVEAMAGNAVVIEVIDGGQTVRYMYPDTITGRNKACNVTRTGRHFPEIAEVLQKMKE